MVEPRSEDDPQSPLTREMVETIEATLLPTLERHHLRLLAHCLASFQQMVAPRTHGPLPSLEERQAWCASNPLLQDDPGFAPVLLQQFAAAAHQLEDLARQLGVTPLELSLDQLITHAVSIARTKHTAP